MSGRNSDTVIYRKVDKARRTGVVKSLVFEFEQLGTNCYNRSVSCGMVRMGSEQSALPKPQNNLSSPAVTPNLVKQRVSQFDLESENLADKQKRHKSTSESGKGQTVLRKDFSRSVSADFNRKEKDRYSRSRQIAPKITKQTDALVNSNQKAVANAPCSDTNNNLQKRSSKKKANHDSASKEENRREDLTSIKSKQKLTQRFNIPENLSILEKNHKDKPARSKDDPLKERKSEPNAREGNKKKIRSVKSIKKVFENSESKPRSTLARKIPRKNGLSDTDTTVIRNDEVANRNRLYSNKHDKNLSNSVVDRKQTFKNVILEECSSDDHYNENQQILLENNCNLSISRQDNGKGATLESNLDRNVNCEYSQDEFAEIENCIQQTIKEMEEHYSSTEALTNDEKEEETEAISSDINKEVGHTILEKDDLDDTEIVNIYLSNSSVDYKDEDEFGKRSFKNSENISFTEAYNRAGDELIVTMVAGIEHRTLSGHFASGESLASVEEYSKESPSCSTQNGLIVEQNLLDNIPNKEMELLANINSNDTLKGISKVVEIHYPLYNEQQSYSTEELQTLSEGADSGLASTRSTIYSSANTNSTDSMELLSKAESEEGAEYEKGIEHIYEEIRVLENNVEIRNTNNGGHERAIKTETIYDSFKNPRIAKVSNIDAEHMPKTEMPTPEEVQDRETPKSPTSLKLKKDYIIEELIDTEKKYIKDLEKVVWDYMPVITDESLPSSLIGKGPYLFGNIKKIYIITRKFYRSLRNCKSDPEEIAKTFLAYKHLFELYALYSKNKPVADQYLLGDFKEVVTVREKELKDRLGLASYLLTPIQRLGKYILFLEQIQKELQKNEGVASDNIYKAIETVRKQMSRGNDFLAIDSIKDSPISLLEQGSFIMRGKFNVIKPKKYEAVLFLFEKILVLTTVDPKNPEMFTYRESIKLNEMGIVTFDDQPLVFHLKRFPSYKKGPKEHHEFVIEAKKNKDKKTWTEQIEKRLWEQLVKCKEEQLELHNNQGMRNSVVDLPDRSRRKKAGYCSLPSEMRKNPPKSIFYYKVIRDA